MRPIVSLIVILLIVINSVFALCPTIPKEDIRKNLQVRGQITDDASILTEYYFNAYYNTHVLQVIESSKVNGVPTLTEQDVRYMIKQLVVEREQELLQTPMSQEQSLDAPVIQQRWDTMAKQYNLLQDVVVSSSPEQIKNQIDSAQQTDFPIQLAAELYYTARFAKLKFDVDFEAISRLSEQYAAAVEFNGHNHPKDAENIAKIAVQVARQMPAKYGFSERDLEIVEASALLHDVGKSGPSLLERKNMDSEFAELFSLIASEAPIYGTDIIDLVITGFSLSNVQKYQGDRNMKGYPPQWTLRSVFEIISDANGLSLDIDAAMENFARVGLADKVLENGEVQPVLFGDLIKKHQEWSMQIVDVPELRDVIGGHHPAYTTVKITPLARILGFSDVFDAISNRGPEVSPDQALADTKKAHARFGTDSPEIAEIYDDIANALSGVISSTSMGVSSELSHVTSKILQQPNEVDIIASLKQNQEALTQAENSFWNKIPFFGNANKIQQLNVERDGLISDLLQLQIQNVVVETESSIEFNLDNLDVIQLAELAKGLDVPGISVVGGMNEKYVGDLVNGKLNKGEFFGTGILRSNLINALIKDRTQSMVGDKVRVIVDGVDLGVIDYMTDNALLVSGIYDKSFKIESAKFVVIDDSDMIVALNSKNEIGTQDKDSQLVEYEQKPGMYLKYGDRNIPLDLDKQYILGRQGDIVLDTEDMTSSRRHAAIGFVDGQMMITDIGSNAGTFVNGQRITEQTVINSGDEIKLGHQVLGFEEVLSNELKADILENNLEILSRLMNDPGATLRPHPNTEGMVYSEFSVYIDSKGMIYEEDAEGLSGIEVISNLDSETFRQSIDILADKSADGKIKLNSNQMSSLQEAKQTLENKDSVDVDFEINAAQSEQILAKISSTPLGVNLLEELKNIDLPEACT